VCHLLNVTNIALMLVVILIRNNIGAVTPVHRTRVSDCSLKFCENKEKV
jgi:cell division protein FtsL